MGEPVTSKIPFMNKKKKCCKKEDGEGAAEGPQFQKEGTVIPVTSDAHWSALVEQSKSEDFGLIVDFTAAWCAPCKRIAPVFEELAKTYKGSCFLKVDIEELEDVAGQCEVTALPAFQVLMKGEKVDGFSGDFADKLKKLAEDHGAKA